VRELERTPDTSFDGRALAGVQRVAVVGSGRLGTALARALREAGRDVEGPLARGAAPESDVALLCVPDAAIPDAARALAGGPMWVGHTSGATGLAALAPARARGAFSLHPLGTFAAGDARPAPFSGLGCAVAGSSPEALSLAAGLARVLGMEPFRIEDERRAAYHAAASMASNFVVCLLGAAEEVAAESGLPPERARRLLAPLVRGAVDNWLALGPARALTGPVARGDEATVALQREAILAGRPELVVLWDALVERARLLARAEATA
jgi:predicted short-subunit dehydrogenase-like oxidoreductase (DUF2520 family)